MEVTYSGTTNAGVSYRSTTPPTEAGQYAVTVVLKAESGYTLAASLLGSKMTIERAPQTMTEAPTIARITTATVTVNPIAGAEYSGNQGASWQTSSSFTGLAPQTSFTVLVRLAETPNYQASEVYSLPARTLENTGLTYEIDFINETISYNDQVVALSTNNFFSSLVPSGAAVTPGLMLFARLVDNGTGSAGASNVINIPARPTAPIVNFHAASYTINSTTAMEFSMDEGASWAVCKDNMDVSFLGDSVILVRYAATENSFRSDAVSVFIPARSDAPALIVDLNTERINTTSAMEYSDNGGASWKPCTPDMSVSALAGKTIMVRKKATSATPASMSAFLNIPERADTPAYNILMSSETLVSDAPFEYFLNNEWTKAESLRLSDLCGQSILIQTAAGDGKFASNRVSVQVPLREETPTVEMEESTLTINTAIGMEFSVDNGVTWNPAAVNMNISAYEGMMMLVRRAVTETRFVSASTAVRIRSLAAAPHIQVDMFQEILNTTTEMEYSTDEGKTWMPAPAEMNVSDLVGGTITVRLRGTDREFPSESASVTIPRRSEAPEIAVDLKTESFTVPAGAECSVDGGETWIAAPSTIMDSMYGETLLFRNPANNMYFVSISVPVALPARPDGPAVTLNMNTMTVNTTSHMEYSVDGGHTWTAASPEMDVSGLQGKNLYIRYAATDSAPASSATTLAVPSSAAAPVVSVDCMSEQLISSEATLEWSQDNGKNWMVSRIPLYVGDYAGQEILFRVPATTENPASASVPVTIPIREAIPNVAVDITSETIPTTTAMEYSLNGGLSWTTAPIHLDVSQMTGEAVLVRTAHTHNTFASLPLSVTVPNRAGCEEVSIDMEEEILHTTSHMDYSLDGGNTWAPASADMSVSGLTGSAVMIRSRGTGFQFASEAKRIAVPVRRTAPVVSADLRNGLFSVPDGIVFSQDSGTTWTAVPPAITDEMLGSTVLFRFPANENQFASAAVSVTLPARADGPTLVLDRDTMTINTTTGMEYALDNVWLPAPANMDVSSFHGHTMQFRYAATDTMPASSITALEIPAIIPVPVLSLNMTEEQILSDQGNEILEYSEDNGETWKTCTMPMEMGDFAGRTLLFRTPADDKNPCSAVVTARIPDRADKPEVFLNMENETVGTTPETGIAYSTDNGETWRSGKPEVSTLTGQTILIRAACTAENLASEPAVVIIPNRKSAPALSIDMAAETISTDPSMEVSVDGGSIWTLVGENMEVSSLTGSTMLVRYACTDTMFHSESAVVSIPVRQDVPVVSVNSGRFETSDGVEFSSDGGYTWGEIPSEITEDLLGQTVLFRFPANERNFVSESAYVTLPTRADGPVLSFDRENLTINTDNSMEYSMDNGDTWAKTGENMSAADLLGEMLLFRYAAAKTTPASSITVLEIPAAISAPVLHLNMAEEQIVSDEEQEVLEYSEDNGISWNLCTMPMEADGFCNRTLLFRTPADDHHLSGSAVSIRVPARADAPNVVLSTENETVTTNLETGVEYSADNGETWTILDGELDISGLTGQTILVRAASTDTKFRSENTIVAIPTRRDAPVVSVGPDRFEIPNGVEFSSDEGETWGPVPSAITEDLLGKTVLFRFPADNENFASKSSCVALPNRADGPILAFDRDNLTINTDSNMEYSTDNGITWTRTAENMRVTNLLGQTLQFRYAATAAMPCSSITILEIPAAFSEPVLRLHMSEERIISDKENAVLEYSADNGMSWKTCTMPMEIGDFCNQTLLFRTPADDQHLNSSAVTVCVPARADVPEATLHMVNETAVTNPQTGMEYSTDSGETWSHMNGELDVSGLTGQLLLVRAAYTDTMFHSEPAVVAIPVRRDAPVVSVHFGKFEIPNGVEFSSDEGKTWGPVPSAITEDLLGKTVLFRFPADNKNFASESAYVVLPVRADGPVLTLDREHLTVNTDTSMEYSTDHGATWRKAAENMSVVQLLGQTLQFRYAAAADIPSSSITTLEIPAAFSAPVLHWDMAGEQIVSDKENEELEYSTNNGESWNPCTMPMEMGSFCNKTLLFRIPADSNHFNSPAVTVPVPARGEVPEVVLSMAKETVAANPETGAEYSADNGETWTALDSEWNVSGLTGQTVLVRTACTDTKFHSENTVVQIPTRRDAPVVSICSEQFEIPNGAEFSSDEGKTWGPVPSAITDELLGKTVLFRFPADDRNFASKSAYVGLPTRADGPILALDREHLTVNTDTSMEYSADNGVTWTGTAQNMSIADLLGKTLQFRYAAAAAIPSSSITILKIPAAFSVPVLRLHMADELLVSDKENETLECSRDHGITWETCTMPMEIGDFSGKTLLFRTPADKETFSSPAVTVLIPIRADVPAISIDMAAETMHTDHSVEFSVNQGRTWMLAGEDIDVSGMTGSVMILRHPCTDTLVWNTASITESLGRRL